MKIKVLANDGISKSGIDMLENNNYDVITENVSQHDLVEFINKNDISCLLVRSATTARKAVSYTHLTLPTTSMV